MTDERRTVARPLKIITIAAVVIALLAGVVFALLEFSRVHTVASSASADGHTRVELIETGSPWFFGPSQVRIRLMEDRRTLAEVDATIYNDGKALAEENWKVTWRGTDVLVTLLGEEQSPMICNLESGGKASCD